MAEFRNTWEPQKGGRYPKPILFQLIGYKFYTEEVGRFHACEARTRIIDSAARNSKSFAAYADTFPECFPDYEWVGDRYWPVPVREGMDERRVWFVGPKYDQVKEFDYLYKAIHACAGEGLYRIASKANSPAQGNMELVLDFGLSKEGLEVKTIIQGKSSTVPDSLQSEEVDFLVLSEAAEHTASVYERYLSTRYKRGIFPTTPKVKARWLRDLIELGEANPGLGIERFRFTPHANPVYDWARYWQEHAQAESRSQGRILTVPEVRELPCARGNGHDCFDPLVRCEAMRDPRFGEQFGGLWTMHAGRVLPLRTNDAHGDSHVLHELPDWFGDARKFVSCDWGFHDPAAAGWFAVHQDGTALLYREIYETELAPDEFVQRISRASQKAGEKIEYHVGDPKKPEVARFMRRLGLKVFDRDKAAMADRKAGHAALLSALSCDPRTGKPRLYVLSDKAGEGLGCPKIIQEWGQLRYRDDWQGDECSEAGFVGRDEGYDLVRYFLLSRFESSALRQHSRTRMDLYAQQHRAVLAARGHAQRAGAHSFTGRNPGAIQCPA